MKAIIKYKGKKISKAQAEKDFGKERIERRIQEAKDYYIEECGCDDTSSWMDGMEITIKE